MCTDENVGRTLLELQNGAMAMENSSEASKT